MQTIISDWLVHCADPIGPRTGAPRHALTTPVAAALVAQAELHGVLGPVLANLALLRDPGFADIWKDATARHEVAVGMNLVLRQQSRRILAEAGDLPVVLVKGPVMADRLYPDPRLRRYSDLDVLAAPEAVAPLGAILSKLGYAPHEEPAGSTDEWKWFHRDRPGIMVEVQTNLIHSERLQSGLQLGYGDLILPGDGRPRADDPASLLVVAAVHGAGHQYERLINLVDVLQAGRNLTAANEIRLERLLTAPGTRFAVATGLDLAGRLFAESTCVGLAKELGTIRGVSLARKLIGRRVLTSTMSPSRSRYAWRRSLYRELLKAQRWLQAGL